MKIALVLMPWYRRESPSPELAMSVALLRKDGHTLQVHDINNAIFNDKFLLRKYWKYFLLDAPDNVEKEFFESTKEVFDYYADQILSLDPEVTILKIAGKTLQNSLNLARIIKKKRKDKIIIVTGILPYGKELVDSFLARQNELPVDYLICGEDDIPLSELIRNLDDRDLQPLRPKDKILDYSAGPVVEDLDSLPYYDFSDFTLESYRFPGRLEIFISRGCPWRCGFCIDWLTEKKYRFMSGERIYQEVFFQAKKHRISHFRFCDKTINGNIKAIDDFCNLMLNAYNDNFPKISWSGDAMIRPQMTKELLVKMHEAGCGGLGYGLESGSDKVLEDIDKKFSVVLAEDVIRNTHEAKIFTSVNIMVGFPTETHQDFQKTLDFIERNKESIDEIRLTFIGCRIYKNSILYNNPEKFNLANVDTDFWYTKDNANNYEERIKRYEVTCKHILDLGIALRVNSRTTKKVVKVEQ